MLLVGYDVPIVQVMYLDKSLKELTLLQAIARVNRLYDNDKNSQRHQNKCTNPPTVLDELTLIVQRTV